MTVQMKKLAPLAVASVSLFLLAACGGDDPGTDFFTSDDSSGTVESNTPTDSSASSRENTANTTSNNTSSKPWESEQKKPTSNATTKPKYPKGIAVANKKGFVKSPYAEYEGLVDVRGFPSGTLVKCPYTSKIFVVP